MTASADDGRGRLLRKAFRMPAMQTMTSRKTSVTNAFVSAIIPSVRPSVEEIAEALRILGMEPSDVRCAYCGDKSSEWDHLRPLVVKRRPTGFISEIANLVPSCGKCNQSKGNSSWREWMLGKADLSPTGRGLSNIGERIARLESYERWRSPTRIDFESIIAHDAWEHYWSLCEQVIEDMSLCQKTADEFLAQAKQRVASRSPDGAA